MSGLMPTTTIDPRALAAFYREMGSRQVEMSLYVLSFFESADEFEIVTTYKFKELQRRGSDSRHPDYEVFVSRVDFSVKRTSVAR